MLGVGNKGTQACERTQYCCGLVLYVFETDIPCLHHDSTSITMASFTKLHLQTSLKLCRVNLLHWVLSKYIRSFPEPPTTGIFSKVLPVQMGGVVRYKREVHCSASWRCTAAFPFHQGLEASETQRYRWGGVLWYKLEVYCQYFQTSCTGWGFLNSAQSTQRQIAQKDQQLKRRLEHLMLPLWLRDRVAVDASPALL